MRITPATPRFSSSFSPVGRLLNAYDFERPGLTSTPMNMTIYGSNILSRLTASRSLNELWENARRDGLSWLCWFYTTPFVQRLVILAAPKRVRNVLLKETPKPVGNAMKQAMWQVNPLMRWHLTSASQIMEYLHKPQYKSLRPLLNELRVWRTGASAVALAMAFFMLGVGISWINIALTRKSVLSSQKSAH